METETDFHLAMLELVVSIDDSHAYFSNDRTEVFWGQYWVPVIFKLIDDKAIITGSYDDSLARIDDLKVGDVITKINSKDVGTIFGKRKNISVVPISQEKSIWHLIPFLMALLTR